MSADSDLDYAVLSGDIALARRLLRTRPAPAGAQASKLLGMAALSQSMSMLEFVHGRLDSDALDRSHAFAYALNQGFAEGAAYLHAHGALEDARGWMERSAEFRRYKMRYMFMGGRLLVDVGTDFFGYILRVYSLENMLGARGIRPARDTARLDALRTLADAGALDAVMCREYALRALLFDRCEVVDVLRERAGFDFAHEFANEPLSVKNYWIHPEMSAEKVELVASVMPPGFLFPLAPRFLTRLETVRAIIPHAGKESCKSPEVLVEYLIASDCAEELGRVQDWGGITEGNIDALIGLAQESGSNQSVALLLDYRHRHFGDDPFAALSGEAL